MTETMPTSPTEIEWRAPDDDVWELDGAHGASHAAVPLRDEMEDAFAEGFRQTFAELGVPLSHIELRHVNGWPYVSFFLHDVPRGAGDPPPAFVLKILTRLHPGFRRRTKTARQAIESRRVQRLADEWFEERQGWIDRNLELQSVDVGALDEPGLGAHLRSVADHAIAAYRRHFELVPGCIPVGAWFVAAERWGLPAAQARLAVMHGTPVHVEAQQRLRRLAEVLGDDVGALEPSFDAVRAHGPEAAAALDDYLAHHGNWLTNDRLTSLVIADFPAAVIGSLRSVAPTPEGGDAASEMLAELRRQVPAGERSELDRLAAEAHRSHTMLDDNSGILGSWAAGIAAVTLRAVGARLAGNGTIADPDHLWALTLDEIVGVLEDPSTLAPAGVASKHAAWRALGELEPPPHLNGPGGPPPDPAVFPAPVATLVRSMTAFLSDKFNYAHTATGIGSGTARGRAIVASDAADAMARIEPGDILVTVATTPAYNAVLPMVAGLVVTEGGPSCHAAIVARELGIPALVGYESALEVPDGATIELDVDAAKVTVIDG